MISEERIKQLHHDDDKRLEHLLRALELKYAEVQRVRADIADELGQTSRSTRTPLPERFLRTRI